MKNESFLDDGIGILLGESEVEKYYDVTPTF